MAIASFYRALGLRLGASTLLLSLVLAGATYVYEMEKIDSAIVASASAEARGFLAAFPKALAADTPRAVLEKALGDYLAIHESNNQGHFLVAEIYDRSTHILGEAARPDAELVENTFAKSGHRFPVGPTPWYDEATLDGRLYLRAVVRLATPDGGTAGFFEGIYHVPDARLAEVQELLVVHVAIVFGAVLCTSLFLLPVFIGVNRHLLSLSGRLMRANVETLEVLGSAIAKRDSDTHAHNYRVTAYAVALAEASRLPAGTIRELIKGAFLHDVGKIAIPDAILLKPAKLTPEEFNTMKAHVNHGLDIVSRSSWLQKAATVVQYHHEKFDGTGYMQGLKGEEIPVTARIFAIADVFDALTSRRPYKEPLPLAETMDILEKSAGHHFDPHLVSVFAGIAEDLYHRISHCGEEEARTAVLVLTARYFQMDER